MLKKCFVPSCSNNSQDSPSKLFLSVPKPDNRRKIWFKSVGENYSSSRSVFCCEDHFNLSIDAQNWVYYKTFGGRIMLYEHVIPHLNLEANLQSIEYSQLSNSEKNIQMQNMKQMKNVIKQDLVTESATLYMPEQQFPNTIEELIKTTRSPVQIDFLINNNTNFLSHPNNNLLSTNLETSSSEFQDDSISNSQYTNEAPSTNFKKSTESRELIHKKCAVRIKKRRKSPICIKHDFSDEGTISISEGIEYQFASGTEKSSIFMNNEEESVNDEPNLMNSSVEYVTNYFSKDMEFSKTDTLEAKKNNSPIFVNELFKDDENNFETVSVSHCIVTDDFGMEKSVIGIKNEFVKDVENNDDYNFEIVSLPEYIQNPPKSDEIISETSTGIKSPISVKVEVFEDNENNFNIEKSIDNVERTKFLVCAESKISKNELNYVEHIQNSFPEINAEKEPRLNCVKNEICKDDENNFQEHIKIQEQLNTELIIKEEILSIDGESCSVDYHQNQLTLPEKMYSKKKSLTCHECDKTFGSKCLLEKHIKRHLKFQCEICYQTFKFNYHLNIHKRSHISEKPYECDVCAKKYTQKGSLIKHQRVHIGLKPYSCDFCDKTFTKKSYLTSHRRSHTGEKPYKCDVCEKCFSQRYILSAHKQQHSGEKPFSCDVCDKTFSKRSILVIHKIQHIRSNFRGYYSL